MSQHPLNLGFRFLLEMIALYAFGRWGWMQAEGGLRFLLAVGLPLIAVLLWGTFRVPADSSANGKAPVPVPGWVRLILELAFFSVATWCLIASGAENAGWAFGGVSLLHYILSYDRIRWLLRS